MHKTRIRKLAKWILILCILFPFMPGSRTISAAEQDLVQMGSLTLHYFYENTEFEIYEIGSLKEDGTIVFLEQYKNPAIDLTEADLEAIQLLNEKLTEMIRAEQIPADYTGVTGQNKQIAFGEIPQGVYLILGETTEEDHVRIIPVPALVAIPHRDESSTNYDVSVEIKHDRIDMTPTTTPIPTPSIPQQNSGNKLPQTGMLWWPVPVMSAAGLVLFAIGIRGYRKAEEEIEE